MIPSADIFLGLALSIAAVLTVWSAREELHWSWARAASLFACVSAVLCAILVACGLTLASAGALAILFTLCVLIAEIDRRTFIIPDILVLATAVLALASPWSPHWREKLLGALTLGGLFWLVRWAVSRFSGKDALGLGDVKLATAMGALLGPVAGLYAVAIAGLATSLVLIALRQRGGAKVAPFGVGLAAALAIIATIRAWGPI